MYRVMTIDQTKMSLTNLTLEVVIKATEQDLQLVKCLFKNNFTADFRQW